MGLDMYLTKRTYVQNWDYMKESEKNHVSVKGADEKHIKPDRVKYIIEELYTGVRLTIFITGLSRMYKAVRMIVRNTLFPYQKLSS